MPEHTVESAVRSGATEVTLGTDWRLALLLLPRVKVELPMASASLGRDNRKILCIAYVY